MASTFKLAFENAAADPAVSEVNDQVRKPDQDPAAQPNKAEGVDPGISEVSKDTQDPALTADIKTTDDPTLDKNTEVEGVDVIDSVVKALATEALAIAIEDEIGDALDASDSVDGMVQLHEVVSGIAEPTETEKRLIMIADALTQGHAAESTPVISKESFNDMAESIASKIIGVTKSVGDSISNIYSTFANFLRRVTNNFRTFQSQLTKLRSMVRKLAVDASKQEATLTVKNDRFFYSGAGDNSTTVHAIKDGAELRSKFGKLCSSYDQFSGVLASAIVQHQKTYVEAFSAIFKVAPSQEIFFNELSAFDKGFLEQLRTKGGLNIKTKAGDSIVARNGVGLAGTFFSVVSPNAEVYAKKSVEDVLKTFDSYHFGPETIDFSMDNKDRELTISVADIDAMVSSLETSVKAFEALNNDKVLSAMMELDEFSRTTVQNKDASNEVMKAASLVTRLQVLEARVVIEGYLKTYYGLHEVIEFVNRFCYSTVSLKTWYEQDIGLN